MPELPEVQVVINYLKTKILNFKIKDVLIKVNKILKNTSIEFFKNKLINSKIINITRKGKYLLFHLNNDFVFIVHLRMEGKFFIFNFNEKYNDKNESAKFIFDEFILSFNDTRQFATFDLIKKDELDNFQPLKKLGIDPIDKNFNYKDIYNKLNKSNKKIKTALLDQTIVSGIGNIYADEILFLSNIHPESLCKKIPETKYIDIANNSTKVLQKSILHNGTTIHSFKYNGFESGSFQNYLMIHSNKIKKCKICENNIEFKKINGRGSYICNKCQKLFL